ARHQAMAADKRSDARSRQMTTMVSGIGSLLSGRKTGMRTAMNQQRMVSRASAAAQRADDQAAAAAEQRALVEQEYAQEVARLQKTQQQAVQDITTERISPPKSGIRMRYFGLVWVPYYDDGSGALRRAWVVPSRESTGSATL